MRFKYLIMLLILAFHPIAQAEGGCPTGQYPQQGQGWQTCVPIPGGATQSQSGGAVPTPPPLQYESRWGAIAADDVIGVIGSFDGAPTEAIAVQLALTACKKKGGNSCKVGISYKNGCGAMTVGNAGFAMDSGETKASAIWASLEKCQTKDDPKCHEYYVGCSPPKVY